MNKLQKPKRDEDQLRFAETMSGLFYDILRAGGIVLTPGNAMERVRSIGERMGKSLSEHSEKKATALIEKLQDNVEEGFVKLEEEFDRVKNLQVQSSAAVLNLLDDMKQAQADIKDLRWCLQKLENKSHQDEMGSVTYDKDNG